MFSSRTRSSVRLKDPKQREDSNVGGGGGAGAFTRWLREFRRETYKVNSASGASGGGGGTYHSTAAEDGRRRHSFNAHDKSAQHRADQRLQLQGGGGGSHSSPASKTQPCRRANSTVVPKSRIMYLIVPSLMLSFVFVHVYTMIEIVWTFSIYLESVAIVPQLFMVPRTSQDESIISHYLFALCSYKAFYLLNWIYRYYEENFYDPVVIVAGIVETVITYFGYYSIFIRPKASGPIRVVVTDAAGELAYSLIFKIANGDVFGAKQRVILHLIDIPSAMGILEGVCMEIDDLALPLVKGYVKTAKLEEAFRDVDAAFLIGTMPNNESKEKKDLLSSNVKIFKLLGKALDKYAKKDVKVLVIGNSANTNALICSLHAPSIPKQNFTAMTRLDQNRAQSAIAIYLGLSVSSIKNFTIWGGNQSSTQFPDVFNALVQSCDSVQNVYDIIKDKQWLTEDFIKIIQSRESSVIQARKKSSAMSAAKAAVDHMHDWWFGTPNGTWVSMGVISDGSYGIPKDLIYSMPVTTYKKQWKIVQGLKINNFAKKKLDLTAEELLHEKEQALEMCNHYCV